MADNNVIVDIQVYSEGDQHFLRLTSDGHEIDRWGPYADKSQVEALADAAAAMARTLVASVNASSAQERANG